MHTSSAASPSGPPLTSVQRSSRTSLLLWMPWLQEQASFWCSPTISQGGPPTNEGCVPEAMWSKGASTSTQCRCTYSRAVVMPLLTLPIFASSSVRGGPLSALRVFCAQPSWSAPPSLTCCPQIQFEQRMSLSSCCFHTLLSYLDLIPLLCNLK